MKKWCKRQTQCRHKNRCTSYTRKGWLCRAAVKLVIRHSTDTDRKSYRNYQMRSTSKQYPWYRHKRQPLLLYPVYIKESTDSLSWKWEYHPAGQARLFYHLYLNSPLKICGPMNYQTWNTLLLKYYIVLCNNAVGRDKSTYVKPLQDPESQKTNQSEG